MCVYIYMFFPTYYFLYMCVCSRSSRQVSMFAFFGERDGGGGGGGGGTLKTAMGGQFQADCPRVCVCEELQGLGFRV